MPLPDIQGPTRPQSRSLRRMRLISIPLEESAHDWSATQYKERKNRIPAISEPPGSPTEKGQGETWSSKQGDESRNPSQERPQLISFPEVTCSERGLSDQTLSSIPPVRAKLPAPQKLRWHTLFGTPLVKGTLGLLIGISLLVAVSRFIDLPATVQLIQQHLTTLKGVLLVLLASSAFVLAFSFRALRWKLFLNPVGRVRILTVMQLFFIGVFLNFLLPIRAGELAKGLVLKRTASIPFSQSLPTITMDKGFDLLPAFFILAIVPILGVQLDSKFWYVLGLTNACLLGLILFVILATWKRDLAIGLLQRVVSILPRVIGSKIEGFITSFIDALLLSAKNPRVLLLAVLLTCVAVTFDGLYNFFAFWAIGSPITFGEAIFGYMLFNLFYILPNPPGQVGSNEVVALLIFSGLLHIAPDGVIAMAIFFHLWSGLLMCLTGMASLSALGVRFSSTLRVQRGGTDVLQPEILETL